MNKKWIIKYTDFLKVINYFDVEVLDGVEDPGDGSISASDKESALGLFHKWAQLESYFRGLIG